MPETCLPFLFMLLIFLVGISIGSFVSMASHRLPRGQEIIFKPSFCTKCHARLGFLDLIPLMSWLLQRGRCRHCGSAISRRYPLIELCLGIGFLGIAWMNGITPHALFLMLLLTELAVLIVTDLEHYIIPDSVQIALLATGILYRIYSNSDAQDIVAGMAGGLALGLALHYGYFYLRKKDGLGFGDVKFLCVAGSWLPLLDFVPFLFLAGLMGIFMGIGWRMAGRGKIFPFGPALAFSLFVNVLFPDILHRVLV